MRNESIFDRSLSKGAKLPYLILVRRYGVSLRPSVFENEMVAKKIFYVAITFSKNSNDAGVRAVFFTVGQ